VSRDLILDIDLWRESGISVKGGRESKEREGRERGFQTSEGVDQRKDSRKRERERRRKRNI